MSGADAAENDVLGYPRRPRLNHHHGVAGAGNDELQLAVFELGVGRHDHVFAVDIADTDGAHGAGERYVGDGERRGGADSAQHVRRVLLVGGEHGEDDLHVIAKAFREEGAQRPVGESGGQDRLGGGATLPPEEAARYLPGRIEALLVVDGQREEIDPFPRLWAAAGGSQDHGLAVADDNGAVRLPGELPRLHPQRSSVHHPFISSKHYQNLQ